MTLFEILSRYFWAVAIGVAAINYPIMKARLPRVELDSNTRDQYAKLLRNYLMWSTIPWFVMGIGSVYGGVPSVWYFFQPRDGNPYVVAWFVSVFVIWVLSVYWLFFRHGAELIAAQPGVFNLPTSSPLLVKGYFLLCLAGGVFGVVMMWTMDVPLPPLR